VKRVLVATVAIAAGACARFRSEPPPPPPPRVDTVTVVREVPPPLPAGTAIEICLSTGFPLQAILSPVGDTLVGPTRILIDSLRPGVDFAGVYAVGKPWLSSTRPIVFERRNYHRSGEPITLRCDDLKRIGDYDGVPIFAMLDAPSPVEFMYVPVRPGMFQVFRGAATRRR